MLLLPDAASPLMLTKLSTSLLDFEKALIKQTNEFDTRQKVVDAILALCINTLIAEASPKYNN
jgi:hypothetical protein